jgi:Nicotinic acid mononucleotide adenylyltransferase
MVRRAIASNPYFKLCMIEVERPSPSYTVDTITTLREQLGAEAIFFFILGRDSLADLPLWKEPSKLIQICKLVVAPRCGKDFPVLSSDLKSLGKAIPGVMDSVIQLDMPVIEISSSEIRKRIAQGLSIRYLVLVPQEVEKYIIEQKLYLTADS